MRRYLRRSAPSMSAGFLSPIAPFSTHLEKSRQVWKEAPSLGARVGLTQDGAREARSQVQASRDCVYDVPVEPGSSSSHSAMGSLGPQLKPATDARGQPFDLPGAYAPHDFFEVL